MSIHKRGTNEHKKSPIVQTSGGKIGQKQATSKIYEFRGRRETRVERSEHVNRFNPYTKILSLYYFAKCKVQRPIRHGMSKFFLEKVEK